MEISALEARLKQHGLRVTQPRVQILAALDKCDRPVNAYRLRDAMANDGRPMNIVSIYRALAVFQEIGLIHYIPSQQGYQLCTESCQNDQETEHLVCGSCGEVTEMPLPECAADDLRDQAVRQGFELKRVRVEIEGRCAKCR